MAYTKTTWVNDQSPDIDADNLNKMEQGIYDAQFPDGGTEGQLLARTANGRGWVDAPNSAVWGLIQGTLSDQTDLANALANTGKVDTVNGIQPDAQKNVQVDVEITKQGWDALPSSKYTDDINYYIKDGTNIPQAGVISAEGVMYTNSQTVKGALDNLNTLVTGTLTANAGVTVSEDSVFKVGRICTVSCVITLTEDKSAYSRLVEVPAGFRPYRQLFRDCGTYAYDITNSGGIRNRVNMISGARLSITETYIVP